jgi:hypothetical protein
LGEIGKERGEMGILVKTVSGWDNVWRFSIWWIGGSNWGKGGGIAGGWEFRVVFLVKLVGCDVECGVKLEEDGLGERRCWVGVKIFSVLIC